MCGGGATIGHPPISSNSSRGAGGAGGAGGARLPFGPLRRGTGAEYASEVEAILRSEPIDVAFLAMAVSDYEPVKAEGKLSSGSARLDIHCRPTPKVIRSVRDWAPGVYLV